MSSIYDRLTDLDISLPPLAIPAGAYVPFVRTGNLVFLSGHIAKRDGKAWVGQLGRRRVPGDVESLVAGRERVALVRIHDVGEPAPEEEWLRAHATVVREQRLPHASVVYFALPPTRR